jgi:signal transduction histidine kinase
MIDQIALTILLGISALLGIKSIPPASPDWQIQHTWQGTPEGYLSFSAESKTVIDQCRQHPSFYLEFPPTIHSATLVSVDSVVIAATSSMDFQHARGFYGSIVIPCVQIKNLKGPLVWEVNSYTQYFAWFKYFPRLVDHYPWANFFNETLNVIAGGVLLVLCLLYLIIFSGKIAKRELAVLLFANFFNAIYFMGATAELMGLDMSMLMAHRMADSGLLIGFLFFIHFLQLEKLLSNGINKTYQVLILSSFIIINTASSGDTIQLGTSLTFLPTLLLVSYAIYVLLRQNMTRKNLFQFIGLFCFFIATANDILVVTGFLESVPILPIGIIGGYVFILLSINNKITETYIERDQLVTELQKTNNYLQKTQDELVKSEKMAAMGRAVARIAHELNTPIYLARTSAQGIQKQTEKFLSVLSPSHGSNMTDLAKKYQNDLITLMKSLMLSISRAAELVKNFKEISVDQIHTQKKEFILLEYIQSVLLTMELSLNRKNITVQITGDRVSFHSDPGLFYQIIQNLIANTERYAYDSGGKIDIKIEEKSEQIILIFSDYGKGIPAAHLPKIFDAFFTTGGGSGGIGLGLNIVYRIVTKQLNGKIDCQSTEGQGTTFVITIPKI